MENHIIQNKEDLQQLKGYLSDKQPNINIRLGKYHLQLDNELFTIEMSSFNKEARQDIYNWVKELKPSKEKELIFGKDNTKNIVSCEVNDEYIELFIEKDDKVTSRFIPNKYWIVSARKFDKDWLPLTGNLFYKYIKYYTSKESFYFDKNRYKDFDTFSISDSKESSMLLNGFTYFKGMKPSEVSTLFFDIEATNLQHNDNSKVLLISNTFCKNEKIIKKLFSYDEYETEGKMIDAWCNWVKETNPSIISGHNIFSYDLPYLNFCANKNGTSLSLGRNDSNIRFDKYVSKFRKDGSQDYDYHRCYIYGRELIDTMFLAYHFDFSRRYESYGLKQIIKQEGLEIDGRQFYDASKIVDNYKNPIEWEKIKKYCENDSDDAKALYDLMIPAFFYLSTHVPKSFQAINYTASGSQINSFLIRSYLQNGYSLPKTSDEQKFLGAISDGFPGIHSNVFKIDVSSLYPSIILQYEIYDINKDPNSHFLQMVKYFTEERLTNKRKGKETGDRYYSELDQMGKIFINSAYGLLGAKGLLFNSPKNAAFVTEKGREILKKAILWATGKEYKENDQS